MKKYDRSGFHWALSFGLVFSVVQCLLSIFELASDMVFVSCKIASDSLRNSLHLDVIQMQFFLSQQPNMDSLGCWLVPICIRTLLKSYRDDP